MTTRLMVPAAVVVDDQPDERGNVLAMAVGRIGTPWDEQWVRLDVNAN